MMDEVYANPQPSLHFSTPFESLIATVLSAQCTDERVNIVTKKLFKAANTPEKILELGQAKLEEFVKPTGFYKAKTKSILGASRILIEKFKGKVPKTIEELTQLPGVGRKTASVVLAQAFKIPAFPVDRHILRVANRLGLSHAKTPEKTEFDLRENIPEIYWIPLHLQLMFHGRKICRPKPKCEVCPLNKLCPEGQKFLIISRQ